MEDTILDRDAYRLLLVIGGKVEQWILEHARSNAEAQKPQGSPAVRIQPAHIRESLRAFLVEGIGELGSLVDDSAHHAESSLRPG